MTEHEVKAACKFVIEHGNREFTNEEKALLKAAVEKSCNGEPRDVISLRMIGSLTHNDLIR